jgi:serine/threonine protein phosphatase PrpC
MNNFESITSEFGKTISGFQMNGASYGSDQQDCIDFKKKGNWLGFAVYDGHAGNETSRWLIGTNNLLDQLLTLATKYEAISSETVTELYKQTDEELKKTKCSRNSQYYYSGSTAVIFIANTETMIGYFINLGDSRAVAVNHSGEIILSTTDHNPRCHKDCRGKMWHANYCEKYRILRAGGVITKQRIESCMWGEKKTSNVSRSFGDFDFKLKTGEDSDTPVSIIPDLYQFDLTKAAHVLLFSDGVIDIKGKGLTNQDVAKLSLDAISQNYNPAQYVCWSAHQKGSIDNISAIVINLHGLINCARKIAATHV